MNSTQSSTEKKSVKLNAVLNIIRQVSNIILPLISYPYILRVIGATNMGKYSFGDSVVRIAMVFAQMGIATYAIREGSRIREDKKKITEFTAEVFTINLITMFISAMALLLGVLFVPRLQKDDIVIYIIGINLVTRILGRDWLNSIYEDFAYITIRYIVFQVISIVLMFAFVHEPKDYILYVIFTVVGNSGGNILNFFYTIRYVPHKITTKLNLKKHLKPILYLFGVALAIEIYIQSDITMLGFFASDDKVGIYSLASKVYTIIKALLNASVVVVIPRLAFYLGQDRTEEYKELSKKLKTALYTLVFPCVVGVFFEAKNILNLVGGKEYVSGERALQILCVAMIIAVLANYYSQVALVIKRKEKIFFWATAISAVVNIVLNLVLIPKMGMEGAAITTVISELIVLLVCRNTAEEQEKEKETADFIKVVIGSAVVAGVCLIVGMLDLDYTKELILAIAGSLMAYGITEIICGNLILKDMIKGAVNKIKKR